MSLLIRGLLELELELELELDLDLDLELDLGRCDFLRDGYTAGRFSVLIVLLERFNLSAT
ncbi:MAG: hypothetical protein EBQ66_02515 [Flavobacteriia bacterium]|nr:hypothetical protein [Flavobacteriia bacterium]